MLCGGSILMASLCRSLISDKNRDEWHYRVAQEATGAHPEKPCQQYLTSINLPWCRAQRIDCPRRAGPKIAPAAKGIANRVAPQTTQ